MNVFLCLVGLGLSIFLAVGLKPVVLNLASRTERILKLEIRLEHARRKRAEAERDAAEAECRARAAQIAHHHEFEDE